MAKKAKINSAFEIQGVKFFSGQKSRTDLRTMMIDGGAAGRLAAREIITEHLQKQVKKILNKPAKTQNKRFQGGKLRDVDDNISPDNFVFSVQSDALKIPDRGYELLYKTVDMTSPDSPEFIDDIEVTTDFAFNVSLKNEEIIVNQLPSTSKAQLTFLNLTNGLNFPDDWPRYNKWYKFAQVIEDVLRWYNLKKAQLAYGVITALSGVDQAFDTDLITTINNAMTTTLDNMEADGSLLGETTDYFILTNRANLNAVQQAIVSSFLLPNDSNSSKKLTYPPSGVIQSSRVPDTNIWTVVPGLRNLHGNWLNLTTEEERDLLKQGLTKIWISKQNYAIFDTNQVRKLALS